MKKTELKELQGIHGVYDNDLDDILDFVNELLETKADELETDEPTAWNAIQRIRAAAYEVFELREYIETIIEEGECRG